LRHVPVGGAERQAGRGDRTLGGGARGERGHDVRDGLAVEYDAERRLPAGFRRGQAGGGRDRDGGRIVVGVAQRDIRRVHAVVDGISAARRAQHDAVRDRAVLHAIVHARDRDRLRDVPVGGGERQAGRGDRTL